MHPVRTVSSNFVYRGPDSRTSDAWTERRPQEHVVYLVWKLTDEDREAIARGAHIKMGIFNMEPIPPVSLFPVVEEEVIDDRLQHRIGEAHGFA